MSAPVMRASDQDREEAVLALSDQYAEGRLDHAEFESRMSRAQQATYLHDLDPLFADLPARVRRDEVVVTAGPFPGRRPGPRPLRLLPLLLVLLTAVVVLHGHVLWLLIPLWWLGFSLARRRAWQRRAWAHAELRQHEWARGNHTRRLHG